jgi:hypothetical protein
MRGFMVTLGALGLLAGWTGTAPAEPPPVAFADCLPPPSVKPLEILLACGDGTESFTVTRWTRRSARALGTAHIDDCTPSCVDGRDHDYRAVMFLDRPRACGGRVLFTRMRLALSTRAGGGRRVGSLSVDGGWLTSRALSRVR